MPYVSVIVCGNECHFKKKTFEIERYARKRIKHECSVQIENPDPRDHCFASLGKASWCQTVTLGPRTHCHWRRKAGICVLDCQWRRTEGISVLTWFIQKHVSSIYELENSVPRNHCFASLDKASWCQTVTLGTEFSIRTEHPYKILILTASQTDNALSCPCWLQWWQFSHTLDENLSKVKWFINFKWLILSFVYNTFKSLTS